MCGNTLMPCMSHNGQWKWFEDHSVDTSWPTWTLIWSNWEPHRLLSNVLQQFNPVIMYMPNIMNPKCVVTDLSNILKTWQLIGQ